MTAGRGRVKKNWGRGKPELVPVGNKRPEREKLLEKAAFVTQIRVRFCILLNRLACSYVCT